MAPESHIQPSVVRNTVEREVLATPAESREELEVLEVGLEVLEAAAASPRAFPFPFSFPPPSPLPLLLVRCASRREIASACGQFLAM